MEVPRFSTLEEVEAWLAAEEPAPTPSYPPGLFNMTRHPHH